MDERSELRATMGAGGSGRRLLIEALRNRMTELAPQRVKVLQLGCDDASMIVEAAGDVEIETYCGIDPFRPRLTAIRRVLKPRADDLELICGDVAGALDGVTGSFDLILAGRSLHDLSAEQRRRVLRRCRQLIAADGVTIVYDLTHGPDERDPDDRVWPADDTITGYVSESLFEACWWESVARDSGYGRFDRLCRNATEPVAVYALAVQGPNPRM